MKVSILTPVFNAESTIKETIASVLNQDFRNWEWILYNDCSTDGSLAIMRLYETQDQRIKIIDNTEHSNGPSYGRNRCFEASVGDIIAFLDADDLWEPGYLNSRVETHRNFPEAGMVYGPAIYFYPQTEFIQDTGISRENHFKKGGLIYSFITDIKSTPCPSGTTVTADCFAKAGKFPESLQRGEDIAFFLSVNKYDSIYYDPTPLFRYRRHPESSTSRANQNNRRLEMELPFYHWLLDFAGTLDSPQLKQIAERSFYGHVTAIASQHNFFKSRLKLFKLLNQSDIALWLKCFFFFDCLLPLRFSKKIRGRILHILRYG